MQRTISTGTCIVVIAACSAPADAQPGIDAAQSFRPLSALFFLPSHAPPARGAVALVPDSKIAWDLQVVARSMGLDDVEVTVHKQVVRLRGSVPNAQARTSFVRAASRSHGVRRVTDSLEVRP